MKHIILHLALLLTASLTAQVELKPSSTCDFLWEYSDFGFDIGEYNNMLPYDYNNDGTIEIITEARYLGDDNTYAWTIIKYNSFRKHYEQVYISPRYREDIVSMILRDVTGDAIPELLLVEYNNLHIIDIYSHETLATVLLSGIWNSFYPAQVRFGDADNDGENEIVVGSWNKLYIVNAQSYEVERLINRYAALLDVGNVDNDPAIEIAIYSGEVLEIQGANISTEYHFHSGTENSTGHLLLEDIDNDGREELIISLAWDSLLVYDLEIETRKYGKRTDGSVSSITVTDIENDNVKEIIFTADQWGDLFTWRADNGVQKWKITNKGHEGRAIAVADFDNDNVKEVVWTTTYDDEGSFHVYNAITRAHEWHNQNQANSIHSLQIADIDNDLSKEIIAIGSKFGELRIFNAITKEIEYESPPYLIPEPNFKINCIVIDDYRKDGDLDIMVGTDDNYHSAIYVIDGNTFTMEASRVFSFSEATSVYDMAYADIDLDNVPEFIILTAAHIIIINSNTFEIERIEAVAGNPPGRNSDVLTGNIDGDPQEEIIVSNDKIYIFDDATFSKTESGLAIYQGIMLYDWDNDGRNEIMATTELGGVHILETEGLTPVQEFQFYDMDISAIDTIDLNQDGIMEFIAASEGHLLFFNRDGKYTYSQLFDGDVALHDGLVVTDLEGDNVDEIFIGTERGVAQLNPFCGNCIWFENQILYSDPKCNEDNGMITFSNPDTSILYLLNGEPVTPPFLNLEDDQYQVHMQNHEGCVIDAEVNLISRDLYVSLRSVNQSCSGEADGIAYLDVDVVNRPYTVQWSTGATTDTIKGLTAGTYEATLIDSLGCVFMNSIVVKKDTLVTQFQIVKPACKDANDGSARINIWFGQPPISYFWDGIPGGASANMLSPGLHVVDVIDGKGCSNQHIIDIPETFVEANIELVAPDCNMLGNGAAEVTVASGNPPFYYTWDDNSHNTVLSNAAEGSHSVIVRDAKQCYAYDTVYIPPATIIADITQNELLCHGDSNGMASIMIIEGVAPYTFTWSNESNDSIVNGLSAGAYQVSITDQLNCVATFNVEFNQPAPIQILLNIKNDDVETPEADGNILAIASGGTPPYQYSWSTGADGSFVEGLSDGTYTLAILDMNGCMADTTIILPFFPSPSCLDTGIVFTKQSQIDSFGIYYPDCHIIQGNVTITGPDILNLAGLSNVHVIEGSLAITYVTSLAELSGLDSLRQIDGDLTIDSCIALNSLNALQSLSNIEGKIELRDNSLLLTLMGLNLDSIHSHLHIFNNDALINLEGLNSLQFIAGRLRINNNSSLQNLSGLSSLTQTGGLWMGDNEVMMTLEGAPLLRSVGTDGLVVSRKNLLINFFGLENLEIVNGQFYITETEYLQNFEGLTNLDTIGYFVITNNRALTTLSGLESVSHIKEGVSIENNDELISLAALHSSDFGISALQIAYNDKLQTLSGLENIKTIKGYFNISSNGTLMDIRALEGIQYTSIDVLDVVNNPLLSECAIKSVCDYLIYDGQYSNFTGNATGCNSEQQVLTACITSTEKGNENFEMIIYPNPAKNEIKVEGLNLDKAIINIIDITNRPGNFSYNDETIFINDLIPGIYLLRITIGGIAGYRKFVKL